MRVRRLVLRRERLAELTTEDLSAVVGGAMTRERSCHITFYPCLTDVDCPTLPIEACLTGP